MSKQSLVGEIQRQRDEINELRELFDGAMHSSKGPIDVRQNILLRAQNMQLERQLLLLSEATDHRKVAVHEVQVCLSSMREQLQEEIAHEDSQADASKDTLLLQKLTQLRGRVLGVIRATDYAQNMRIRLPKEFATDGDQDSLKPPLIYSGQTDHIDFTRVHGLEVVLTRLMARLAQCRSCLLESQALQARPGGGSDSKTCWVQHARNQEQRVASVTETLGEINDALGELEKLGMLLPRAPRGGEESEVTRQLRECCVGNRKLAGKTLKRLWDKVKQQELAWQAEKARVQEEREYHHEVTRVQTRMLAELVEHCIGNGKRASALASNRYGEVDDLLRECVGDYERNSGESSLLHVNLNTMVAQLKLLLPSVEHAQAREKRASEDKVLSSRFDTAFETLEARHNQLVAERGGILCSSVPTLHI